MQKILIVDDDPNIAFLVQMALSKIPGYTTEIANNGQDGLERIEAESPDLVLLDVMMPGMDGFEVCRRIKANDKTRMIPVIMITAKSEIGDKLRGIDIGAIDYITKPFNPDELLARVKAHLRIRELERQLSADKEVKVALKMAVTLQHEINNPLTGVLGNIELLKDWKSLSDEERDHAIKDAHDLSLRIKELVQEMNNLTTIVSTTYVGDSEMIDIRQSRNHNQ